MCLAVPLKAVKKSGKEWLMEDGRKVRNLAGKVAAGDYLICQQDLAIEKIGKDKAKLIRNALRSGI